MAELSGWTPPPLPPRGVFEGRYVTLEPLEHSHIPGLWAAHRGQPQVWEYIPAGPFESEADLGAWVDRVRILPDPLQFAVRLADGRLSGTLSLLRINPASGSIEVGYIVFTPMMQQSPASTEAVYLLMRWAFEAGYRRFEWKCNVANLPSRRAAERFGLSYEGIFRQADVVKGKNRDTAWYAAIDAEWPALHTAFEAWLDPSNFNARGAQRSRLSEATRPILVTADPALKAQPRAR